MSENKQEEIKSQINPKLSKTENIIKLSSMDFDQIDIQEAVNQFYTDKTQKDLENNKNAKPSKWRLNSGAFFVCITIYRIFKFANDPGVIHFITVLTGASIAYWLLSNDQDSDKKERRSLY